jgi:iron complex outermembrane recepter protein
MKRTSLSLMITACFIANAAAQETKSLSPVVVTATRVEQDSFDLPMSIDKVEKDTIQNGGVKMTLSESLARVPGITAQNRNQMAQDPQISSRGFGARSSFGVRGIRVYVDGIPLSMPDGIGNPGNIDLGALESIEVLKGPFSSMYGSSSGGVIQMFTQAPTEAKSAEGDILFGSFGTRREQITTTGKSGEVGYYLNYSDYKSDGFRQNSANDKQQATAKLTTNLSESTKLTTLINWFNQNAQDPGGMLGSNGTTSDPSVISNPSGVFQGFLDAKTRVARANTQVGFNLNHKIDSNNSLNMTIYAGQRENKQFLYSNPASVINDSFGNPICTSSTGVTGCGRASTINRDFYGTELNGTNKGELFNRSYSLTAGVTYGVMKDKRLDVYALNGIEQPATVDNVNRDEVQVAKNFDQFVQAKLSATESLDIHAGLRHSTVKLDFTDNVTNAIKPALATDAKFNDSTGNVSYGKTTPVVGMLFKANPTLNFYANFGQAFETPTLVETSFTTTTGTGPNLSLKPSTSDNIEVGTKWLISDKARLNLAMFDITTENEIIASQNQSGRIVFSNAPGKTKRNGAELAYSIDATRNLSFLLSYTMLDATFDNAFTVSTTPNSTGTVNKGNKIPGTYKSQIYAEAAWKSAPIGFSTALEARYTSKVFANDLNTEFAPSSTIFSTRASFQQTMGRWKITEYARIENIFDESYIGSVRINEYSGRRYFEPAPGRNWIMGVKANYMF